jgi:sialidase-1
MAREPLILNIVPANDANPRNSEGAIVERSDGSLLLAWQEFSGSGEGSNDTAPGRIAAMDSFDSGRTWENRRVLVENDPGDVNVYSPNFLRLPARADAPGELLFFFQRYNQLAYDQEQLASIYVCRSQDEGASFSAPQVISSRQSVMMPSSVVKRLSTGRIVLPVVCQQGLCWSTGDHVVVGAAWSDDDGHTWRLPERWANLPLRGAMEPHVEELKDGRLLMVMRTQLGSVFQAHSADGGETWSLPQTTGLHAPESCPELVRIPQTGDLMIVWNNAPYNPGWRSHYGKRTPLTVAISRDEGATWGPPKDIESDPGWAYSNPGVMFTSRGECLLNYWAVLYTPEGIFHGHIHLKLAILDGEWLYG